MLDLSSDPARVVGSKAALALVVSLLGAGVLGCGGSTIHVKTAVRDASSGVTRQVAESPTMRGLVGDEDDDDSESKTWGANAHADGDNDQDYDRRDNAVYGYYDPDDSAILTTGHLASVTDGAAVTAAVLRYYTIATQGNGRQACAMMDSALAKSLPEDYGGGAGPAYIRGAKTCGDILSRIFKHERRRLGGQRTVTAVRIVGPEKAMAIVGSHTNASRQVQLAREHGAWKVESVLGSELP